MVQALLQSYQTSGIAAYWQWMAKQLQDQRAQGAPVNAIALAMAYANLNRNDDAMLWLETAFDERALWLPFLAVEPMLAPLHDDPRFTRLLQRVGITNETLF